MGKRAPVYPTHKADALANFRREERARHTNNPWPAAFDALVDAGVSPRMLREAWQRGTAIIQARSAYDAPFRGVP